MPELDGIAATRADHRPAPDARARAHDLRPRRVRLRRAAGRARAASCSRTRRRTSSPTAIRAVAAGEALLAPDRHAPADRGVRARRPAPRRTRPAELDELTPRELEVLRPARARPVERRDRREARPHRDHGQDPRRPPARQARAARPRAGRRARLRDRASSRRAARRRKQPAVQPRGDGVVGLWVRRLDADANEETAMATEGQTLEQQLEELLDQEKFSPPDGLRRAGGRLGRGDLRAGARTTRRSGPSAPRRCTGTPSGTRCSTGRTRRSRSGSSAASSTSPTTASTATSRPATATASPTTGAVRRARSSTSPTPTCTATSRSSPTR